MRVGGVSHATRFAVFVALASCSPDAVSVSLARLPGDPVSEVLAVTSGDSVRVFAHERALGELRIPIMFGADARVVIEAFAFDAPLAELALVAGELEAATAGAPDARALPQPEAVFTAEVGAGGASVWAAGDARLLSGFSARVDPTAFCRDFQVRSFDTGAAHTYVGATALDASRVLVVGPRSTAWIVETSTIHPTTSPGESNFLGAWRAPDGELWIGDVARVWRGTLDGGFTSVPAGSDVSSIVFLQGPRTANTPIEVFALSIDGFFGHISGGAWSTLFSGNDLLEVHGGVVWIGPGEVISAGADLDPVVWYHDETVELVSPSSSIESITWTTAYGAVAIETAGRILRFRDGAFELLAARAPIASPRSVLGGYGDTFVLATSGSLSVYDRRYGFCPPILFPTDLGPRAIAPLADGFVIAGAPIGGATAKIVVVTPR